MTLDIYNKKQRRRIDRVTDLEYCDTCKVYHADGMAHRCPTKPKKSDEPLDWRQWCIVESKK